MSVLPRWMVKIGFFQFFFHHFVLAKLATTSSIRVEFFRVHYDYCVYVSVLPSWMGKLGWMSCDGHALPVYFPTLILTTTFLLIFFKWLRCAKTSSQLAHVLLCNTLKGEFHPFYTETRAALTTNELELLEPRGKPAELGLKCSNRELVYVGNTNVTQST